MKKELPKLPIKLKQRSSEQRQKAEKKRMDLFMRTLKAFHSVSAPESMEGIELERQRKSQDVLGKLAAPMGGLTWTEFDLDGMSAAWMRLKAPHAARRVILYCHGGGYTSGNLGYSRVLSSKLCHATGMDVLSFDYRLAPEHPYPAAVDDGLRAWAHLIELGFAPEDVVIAGDSAGGNMALVICHRLKQLGQALPRALVLMSPWTDMTMSGESYTQRTDIDPMLTLEYIRAVREAYAGDCQLDDPTLSPLFADLRGFPPTLIQVGTHEILFSDSQRLEEALTQAGVSCRLEVWEDMWHVFQMVPLKKSNAAINHVSYYLMQIL